MSEPEELEYECVLEDNDDLNDVMAEPYGTARLVNRTDGIRLYTAAPDADVATHSIAIRPQF